MTNDDILSVAHSALAALKILVKRAGIEVDAALLDREERARLKERDDDE